MLMPPSFSGPAEERLHRKRVLPLRIDCSRASLRRGRGGHITARDPERKDCFWVNPFGKYFGAIKASDLCLCDHDGNVLEGEGPINRAAFAIHSRVHAARPDVVAAAHSHSPYGKTWSALGRRLDPITQDACAFFEDHGLFDDFTGVVVDTAEGDRIAAALGSTRRSSCRTTGAHGGADHRRGGVVVHRHGALCQAQLMAEAGARWSRCRRPWRG